MHEYHSNTTEWQLLILNHEWKIYSAVLKSIYADSWVVINLHQKRNICIVAYGIFDAQLNANSHHFIISSLLPFSQIPMLGLHLHKCSTNTCWIWLWKSFHWRWSFSGISIQWYHELFVVDSMKFHFMQLWIIFIWN